MASAATRKAKHSAAVLAVGTSSLMLVACSSHSGAGGPDGQIASSDTDAVTAAVVGLPIPSEPVDRSNEAELTRQWWEAKAQCHTDHGYPAHWDGEGIVTDVGPDQRADYQKMTALCQEEVEQRLGPHPQAIPYSAEELGALYELLVEETVACLGAEGITVEQPQSKETWVEYQTKMYTNPDLPDTAWNPYRNLGPNLRMDMQKRCPEPTGADITRWLDEHGNR